MTEQPARPTAPPPREASDVQTGFRQLSLETYLWSNRDKYTEAALASAAEAAGYAPEEVAAAAQVVATRRADEAAARPVRARARRYVLVAYGLTWLIFAFLFLRPEPPDSGFYRGSGPAALGVLAFMLFITLLLALAWVGRGRPSAAQAEGALGVMLAVPFVLLVIVAGLCVTTTRPLIFGPG